MSLFRLLDQISRILFEPFFIFMIVGFFLVILLNWRRRDRFFYFFLVAFGVMLTWRYVVNLVSKRYSEILIYAGICMTAYFLALFPSWISCRFHPFLQRHFRRMDQMLHQYPRLVSRVLILILTVKAVGIQGLEPVVEAVLMVIIFFKHMDRSLFFDLNTGY